MQESAMDPHPQVLQLLQQVLLVLLELQLVLVACSIQPLLRPLQLLLQGDGPVTQPPEGIHHAIRHSCMAALQHSCHGAAGIDALLQAGHLLLHCQHKLVQSVHLLSGGWLLIEACHNLLKPAASTGEC
jgi:hypothetical protein